MPREDIAWALARYNAPARRNAYKLYRDYYEGRHRMAFNVERFREVFRGALEAIVDNVCPAVIDSLEEELELSGFSSSAAESVEEQANGRTRVTLQDELAELAWDIWRRNRMDLRASEVHRDSLLLGDAFVIVWPNSDDPSRADIWPQDPESIVVEYDEETPGRIARAAKVWRTVDGQVRINLYYPDAIEKYVTRRRRDVQALATDRAFAPLAADDADSAGIVPNSYGVVPVFHFPNKRTGRLGASELADVIPLQDGLNKTACDKLVAQEFSAFAQRWIAGLEVEVDESTDPPTPKQPSLPRGADKYVTAADPETRFGSFETTDLRQFLEAMENDRAEIARVSGIPLHRLFITRGDYPSGEAMKSAEKRFTRKVSRRQAARGNNWEDVMLFALTIELEDELPAGTELSAGWRDASPRSEQEIVETAARKKEVGVSQIQIQRELGYTEDQIDRMRQERELSASEASGPPPPAPSGGD